MTRHTRALTMEREIASARMSRGMTLLFAVTSAVAIGNLYWAQPLLNKIAAALNISATASGTLITVTQLGYALGVALLVPLGDSLNRRHLIPVVMGLSVLGLLFSALAPNYLALLSGLASLSGQLLLPLAGDLASDYQREQAIGTIAAGILIGIMLSRLISGLIADAFGWRAIYLVAAAVNVVFAVWLAMKRMTGRERAFRMPGC